ncbi:MAG: cyclic nucleotide-binding domain-containing protein [bacterium]
MILNDLTSSEMADVEAIGLPRRVAPGEAIIREGEAGSSFFLVLDGRVEVRKSIGLDKHKKLVELGSLDIFGEVCFLGVESRSASVLALESTHVLEFSRAAFEKLIVAKPAIGLKLYRGIARELARRLAYVDGELRDALIWALGDMKIPPDPTISGTPRKLSLTPLQSAAPTAKIVVV